MKKINVLVIGNIFESKSLIVRDFCECDNEVVAEKIFSRLSGAAIVVSAIAAFLYTNATIITKAKKSQEFCELISKLSELGVDTTQIDYSSKESNTLITIYNLSQDRKCYSFLPAQIKEDDLINIDYSIYDAVFFCCLPYNIVNNIFIGNMTISHTQSVILASGMTSEYFAQQKLMVPANYVFCNRGELLNVLDKKRNTNKERLKVQIGKISAGNTILVITMGKDGVVVVDGETIHKVTVAEIKNVIHPGGAGDAFATGFICGKLKGMDVDQCCSLGYQCAKQMLSVSSVVEFVERILKER